MDDFEFERLMLNIGGTLLFGIRVFHFADLDLVLVDGESYCFLADMDVVPMHLKEAREYIAKHHCHCSAPSFHKFAVSLQVDGEPEPVGVAVASTPKSRHLMDGRALEINRVCTDPCYRNACSKGIYAYTVFLKIMRRHTAILLLIIQNGTMMSWHFLQIRLS